jgi:hypothetical protein
VRSSYSRKLELGTAWLLQRHPIAGNRHLVNGRCKRRLDFDSVLVTEFVPATYVSEKHSAIRRKLPEDCVRSSHHAPFADDASISAASDRDYQDDRGNYL